jgi:20S proteasome alpha/beta subunit
MVLYQGHPMATTLLRQDQEDEMDQAGIVTLIDEALKRFAGRDLVSSNEVLDLLLDMRTAAVSDAAIAALIDSEAQPAH